MTVTYGVTDVASANSVSDTIRITVAANRRPTISFLTDDGAPSAIAGTAYKLELESNDPDDDPLTYSIANRPPWVNFDTRTGIISGTPTATGEHNDIMITVSDGTDSASLTFNLRVTPANIPPTISGTPPTTIAEDATYSFTALGVDPDDDPLTYTLSSSAPPHGSGSTPPPAW